MAVADHGPLEAQVIVYLPSGLYLVHGVEMNAGSAIVEQSLAQLGNHLQPELADAILIIPVRLHPLANPARDFCPAVVRKAQQVGEVGNRHDTRINGLVDARSGTLIQEVKVGLHIIEILGDGTAGTRIELAFEKEKVGVVALCFRVDFRIGRTSISKWSP